MTDLEQSAAAYLNGGNGNKAVGRLAATDNFSSDEGWAVASGMGLVSLGFLKAAIRRSAAFICVMTFVGFVIGIGADKVFPPLYHASTTLLLTEGPYENGINSAADDQTLAQTNTVAVMAMHKLGVRQSPTSFVKAYQVTVESQRVLLLTFSAGSASQAVRGANAVAAALLQFRAGMLEAEQEQVFAAQQQQVRLVQQQLHSLGAQISQLSAQHASPGQQSQLRSLRAHRTNATETLASLQQALNDTKSTIQPATVAAVKGSKALYAAAALPRSRLKSVFLYPLAGLIAGLILALVVVSVRAIVSDRPRRRGDVADALHAHVALSTGPLRTGGRLSPAGFWPGRAGVRKADIERIVTHLRRAVRQSDRSAATLAVVVIDDPETAALPVVSLANSMAQQGLRVVLADLASGAPAARLLGSGSPGVRTVNAQVAGLVVAVPEHNDVVPQGPLGRGQSPQDQSSAFTNAVATAHSKADLLLSLVTLHASFGGEHLRTWADDAVVMVVAGRSSWTRINAVGELIRMSGTRLLSAVLVGADPADESLGVTPAHHLEHAGDVTIRKAEATTSAEGGEETRRSAGSRRVHVLDDPLVRHWSASRDEPLA